jgi:hypothetical protein
MEGFWYYAIDSKQIGPLTFAQLTASLSGLSNSRRALLWMLVSMAGETLMRYPNSLR